MGHSKHWPKPGSYKRCRGCNNDGPHTCQDISPEERDRRAKLWIEEQIRLGGKIEARSVTEVDSWGVTRVVGGFGDVGGPGKSK